MKSLNKVILMMTAAISFAACTNHSDNNTARDTVGNRYGADTAKVEKINVDTAKVTDKTGDASSIDNSGSGGTGIAKDTVKKNAEPKKK